MKNPNDIVDWNVTASDVETDRAAKIIEKDFEPTPFTVTSLFSGRHIKDVKARAPVDHTEFRQLFLLCKLECQTVPLDQCENILQDT
jgi:hypothetical protein